MDLQTVDQLLRTTRSVRKRLDLTRPVEPAVLEECLELAVQAPSGSNQQKWHFVVVTDAKKKAAIAEYYRKSFASYLEGSKDRTGVEKDRQGEMIDSAVHLAEHLQEVPVLLIACVEGRFENAGVAAQASRYGSVLPAVWSLMLALRARGIGAAWTTLHLAYEREVGALLGIPPHMTQAVMLPIGYFTGADFKPARRAPAKDVTYWNGWGETRQSVGEPEGGQ